MLCEKCGKNHATTHIRSVVNGVAKELNLCSQCASDYGYTNIHHNSLAGMLASLFADAPQMHSAENETRCPVCNSGFSDIAKSGKAGCAECYKVFGNRLMPYLKRVHGSTRHAGKVPNSAPLMVKPDGETVEGLRLELNRLVAEEKYEQAAVIRDKIKKLEGEKNE